MQLTLQLIFLGLFFQIEDIDRCLHEECAGYHVVHEEDRSIRGNEFGLPECRQIGCPIVGKNENVFAFDALLQDLSEDVSHLECSVIKNSKFNSESQS